MTEFKNRSATAIVDDLAKDVIYKEGREVLLKLINQLSFTGRGIEVGTWTGTFAETILRDTKIGQLICVDPYVSYEEFRDCMNFMDLDAVFSEAKGRLEPFGTRGRFIRKFSTVAVGDFEDGSLDFVYLDGNHQYEYVRDDLVCWWPKIKDGGLLIGDDCSFDGPSAERNERGDVAIVHLRDEAGAPKYYGEYGVQLAVDKFSKFMDLDYRIYESQFLIAK